MKPYEFGGRQHSNMRDIVKWGQSSRYGERRRLTRRASATVRSIRQDANGRARANGKKITAENNE